MDRINDLVAMGGYGAFVWGAYGVCALILVTLAWSTVRRLRANERTLRELRGSDGRRSAEAQGEGKEANRET